MKKGLENKKYGDISLLIIVVILACIGLVFVYSASSYNAQKDYGNKYYYLSKQTVGVVIGIACMIFTAKFDYNKYRKFSIWFYLLGLLLLGLVFVPKIGVESYGAKRWIGLFGITVQPSEIAKFGFVFITAWYLDKSPYKITSITGIIPILLFGGAVCLLIMLEPNMSVTMCVGVTMLIMLFVCGAKWKHFSIILIPVILLVPILIIAEPYRLKRLYAFINPWASPKNEGYQLIQSLYALGSGGLVGVGLFNSRQKYRFLPFSESDFILSIIGEEIGFFGILSLFFVMFMLVIKCFKIAVKCRDFYGFSLSIGITAVYSVQVMINALVVTGSIPPTGLPLPLISSGNTSIIVFMSMFGVLYNISKNGYERNLVLSA